MICPNADGSESPTYHEHNDSRGQDARRAVEINRAERARQSIPDDVTLYMSRHDLQRRLREAHRMSPAGYMAAFFNRFCGVGEL